MLLSVPQVDYAVKHKLGGIMLWSLDLDDFRGAFCGQGRYPLLKAIVSAVGSHYPDVSVKVVDSNTVPHPSSTTLPTSISTLSTPSTRAPSSLSTTVSSKTTITTTPAANRTSTTAVRVTTTRRHVIIIEHGSFAPVPGPHSFLLSCAVILSSLHSLLM